MKITISLGLQYRLHEIHPNCTSLEISLVRIIVILFFGYSMLGPKVASRNFDVTFVSPKKHVPFLTQTTGDTGRQTAVRYCIVAERRALIKTVGWRTLCVPARCVVNRWR